MADIPIWAASSPARKTMSEIYDLLQDMKLDCIPLPREGFTRKADAVAFIEEQRRIFWDERQRKAAAVAAPRNVEARRVYQAITVAEVNEFLRSLPPVPLYGEGSDHG